jgi:hypothetical protein
VQLGFAELTPFQDDPDLLRFILTDVGRAFDDAANVYADEAEAQRLLREAYLRMPTTQALMQGLHGRGPVPVSGGLHLLARHGLLDASALPRFRAMLSVLNSMGVLSYSVKHQTIRITAPMPSEEDDREPAIRVVEPDRQYSNIRHLRETLRACRDFIWWADPHFEKRGFEPLTDEADAAKVKSIRILSGTRPSAGDIKDYERFKSEMAALGITVEYRIVAPPDREWHDRYIVTKGAAWNVPPLGAVVKGSYSEFSQTEAPPFDRWWKKGKPIEDL